MPSYAWLLLHLAPATWSVYHALLYKRDPRAAMGWIMACIFIPYAGPLAYYLFGINRVRTRARGLKQPFFRIESEASTRGTRAGAADARGLHGAGQRVTGQPLRAGNDVRPLYNGETAYPAMLASINEAKHRVLLSTFILKADHTGRAFADALKAAAARGVVVKVLVDGIGELYSFRKPSSLLRKSNIKFARFLPPRLLPPSIYVNLRNHRKLLIIDSDVGYAGGMNIGDAHTTVDSRPRRVSDVHFQLRGPIVADLATLFMHDWQFATKSSKPIPEAPGQHRGDMQCRIIPDGPDAQMDTLSMTIQAVISAAVTSVDIMTPYFLPGRELISSLESAALRGVKVRIVLPGKNNLFYVHWANRNILAELLQRGIKVFYQPAPFCHSKLLCIDHDYSLIGSANLDPRSLRLNFELGIEIISPALNDELRTHIQDIIDTGEPVVYETLKNRSVAIRLRDSAMALLSPYL